MLHRAVSIVLLTPALFLGACQSSAHSVPTSTADTATITRDQGYALLYSTISEECGVDNVLTIKSPAPQVAELIKDIGQFSRDAKATLQNLAREDPAIALDSRGLPEVEAKTRGAIGSATSGQILFSGGKELEFRLLLTQHEALNYITHLAGALAAEDPPGESQAVSRPARQAVRRAARARSHSAEVALCRSTQVARHGPGIIPHQRSAHRPPS